LNVNVIVIDRLYSNDTSVPARMLNVLKDILGWGNLMTEIKI